jgi:uncharacterized protein YdaU (DUF1376 family)
MGLCWLLTSPSTPEMVRVSPRAFFIGKAMHYYQFNIGDYISHTSHLTDAEDLTYRRMLDLYYQTEMPFDEINKDKLARKVKSTIEIVEVILSEFFEYSIDDCAWHNKRADSEIKAYQSKADSARKANQIRWGSAKDVKPDVKSDAIQILNNKQETINNKHSISKPDDVSLSVWTDFVAHRKLKKATITETVINSIRKESEKAGITFEDALSETCARGWQGFKAEWYKKSEAPIPPANHKWWK